MEKFNDNGWFWGDRLKSCKFLNELAGSNEDTQSYIHVLEMFQKCNEHIPIDSGPVLNKNGLFFGSFLYFSANLHGDGKNNMHLELQSPEKAHNRRIYRKYGSHRFLEIRYLSKVGIKDFEQPLWLCGRCYRFLWAKKEKSPQIYVFFAEKGTGIDKCGEMFVGQVQDWMIPRQLNQNLTVGKYFKRVKLNFSKTISAGVLPENSLEVIPDIINHEKVMTDGCGLISRELMKDLQKSYNQYVEIETNLWDDKNPNTGGKELKPIDLWSSFQGRIGGFKGVWVLDPHLKGKTV